MARRSLGPQAQPLTAATGAFRCWPPFEAKYPASPKEKTPPPEAAWAYTPSPQPTMRMAMAMATKYRSNSSMPMGPPS